MEKIIKVGNKEIGFKATALIPRIYRNALNRDLVKDMQILSEELKEEGKDLTPEVLTIFENLAWAMAYQYDKTIPNNPDDWLDTIEGVFNFYTIMPQIMELWAENTVQTSEPAKK